jgi:signal transduction histidine kinase/DNA-binding response OmpR family regulator
VAGRRNSEHDDSGIRLRAFKAAIKDLNLEFDPNLTADGLHIYEGGRQAIHQIINREVNFTAVIASNDSSSLGVLDGLRQAGFVVPQDIALVGFDDRLEARALIPPLTTVHYPMFRLGYQAVELLLQAIKGESVINELVTIPTSLVIRESCGCLPGIPSNVENSAGRMDEPRQLTREEVISQLTQKMTTAVHKESLWLNKGEIAHLGTRLVEAFLLSLEQNDPPIFLLMIKQILERVSVRGDDLFTWQTAITILRDQLPLIQGVLSAQLSNHQEEAILHQGRVAISEVALGQFTRSLLNQAREADQVGLMTSKFFAANDEREIFDVLAVNLPAIGIQSAMVGYYEAESEDPVTWSVLQTPGRSISGAARLQAGLRFPSRQFPPDGLYPIEQAFQLALLPLKIQEDLCGFVAFDASNLDPCADIVRQLGAALRSVRLYQEAVEARQMAEEANRLKSRFLSMVSHELRTPLNLITGLSNILLDEYDVGKEFRQADSQDSFTEDLQRIYISAQHLDGLIRDVLDLASSDVEQLKLVCEPLDMTEVLEAVAVIGEQLAHDKGLAWQVEIAKNLPRVWGDRTRLRQVALNLVSNAVKFTTRGEINLTALVENGQVVVSINDTGLGIPLHEQKVIFDEFRQSERTTARGYGGLGLGLAICRKLVEMHGGEIGVCSSGGEGEGSMFFFSLPVLEQQMDLSTKTVPISKGQRVLLLVKHAKGSDLLQKELSEQGYEAEVCLIQEESDWLATLLLAEPDVVMLDLGLTSERGWEILKILKENPSTTNIPVLFYSVADDAERTSLLEIDYLTKPVGSTVLAELLASKGFLNPEGIRDDGRAILVVDDDPGMLELHARMVEAQLPDYRVLMARDGRQALQLIFKERPTLVLLDLMMPELDGFAVLEEMQKTDLIRNIPVVVITGQVLTEEDMLRLNSGVASVLEKGMFSGDETLQHLTNALERKRKSGSETQRIALKAVAYIHAYYTEPISRSDVASHVGLSERHLTRCFRQEMRITPITYLNRYRVKQAKALLDSGERGITETAMDVGFSSSSYFTRVFREQVGVTPRAYLQSRCFDDNE